MRAFERIADLLDSDVGSAIVGPERLPLNKGAFSNISPACEDRLVFVDSGSGDILSSSHASVSLLRLCVVHYVNNKRASFDRREWFVVISPRSKDGSWEYSVVFLSRNGDVLRELSVNPLSPSISSNGRPATASSVLGVVRKLVEFETCASELSSISSGIVVRDGDLEADNEVLSDALGNILRFANSSSLFALGLSKSSRLLTDKGVSAQVALDSIAPEGAWVYDVGANIVFLKLHSRSNHIFRCDLISRRSDDNKVWSALVANASDPSFLGYPYGLADADKFAQVTMREASSLRAHFALVTRERFSSWESCLNAHDILNKL
ncbi:hypothetical protein D6825_02670 [Candidatus Woesearchaeota archaeon]|nr:MAG: hypothetical protein D6825_02670 [Candidatus Woesearchaeota archaeon]